MVLIKKQRDFFFWTLTCLKLTGRTEVVCTLYQSGMSRSGARECENVNMVKNGKKEKS